MKANEFVKKYGIEYAMHILSDDAPIVMDLNYIDLKRLVESHELVESYTSRFNGDAEWFFVSDYCKKNRISPFFSENYDKASSIYKQAIADVESCL